MSQGLFWQDPPTATLGVDVFRSSAGLTETYFVLASHKMRQFPESLQCFCSRLCLSCTVDGWVRSSDQTHSDHRGCHLSVMSQQIVNSSPNLYGWNIQLDGRCLPSSWRPSWKFKNIPLWTSAVAQFIFVHCCLELHYRKANMKLKCSQHSMEIFSLAAVQGCTDCRVDIEFMVNFWSTKHWFPMSRLDVAWWSYSFISSHYFLSAQQQWWRRRVAGNAANISQSLTKVTPLFNIPPKKWAFHIHFLSKTFQTPFRTNSTNPDNTETFTSFTSFPSIFLSWNCITPSFSFQW